MKSHRESLSREGAAMSKNQNLIKANNMIVHFETEI